MAIRVVEFSNRGYKISEGLRSFQKSEFSKVNYFHLLSKKIPQIEVSLAMELESSCEKEPPSFNILNSFLINEKIKLTSTSSFEICK